MQKKMASMDPSEMVNIAFDSFDNDGDKAIGAEDLMKVMTDMGEKVSQDEIDELIRIADTDGDGKLSVAEFTEWMKTR
jgi:calmodulin